MEDTSLINESSKYKISENLNTRIDDMQEEINILNKKLNDIKVLKSKNEIKLKLSKEEALKSKSFKEGLKSDIIESQKENFKLIMEEESNNKRIDIIEKQITCAKNINENIDVIFNEKDFNNKFILFKGEGELNTIINRVLFLNNNYQTNIFKLDNLNMELNTVLGEPNNSEKITQLRDNIQTLLEETQEINRIVKKEMKKDFSSFSLDDNIPFERCPGHLDKIFVDSYNKMNSNVCLLLSFIIVGANGGKQIIENINEFVETNVGDVSIKKNLENQISTLNECVVNTNQFYNNLDQLIKDIFDSLTKNGDNINKKNRNENGNEITKSVFTANNELVKKKDEKIKELNDVIEVQHKTIIASRGELEKLKENVNQLNEFLKLNEKNGKLDVKKIANVFDGYNQTINNLTTNLGKIEEDTKIKVYSKDLNTGKFLLGQFYSTISNFMMDLYNYGFRDEK